MRVPTETVAHRVVILGSMLSAQTLSTDKDFGPGSILATIATAAPVAGSQANALVTCRATEKAPNANKKAFAH